MGSVIVRHAGRSWRLAPGAVLTLGRGTSCDIRLPDDAYISRRAASLRLVDGQVLIRNDSGSKSLTLRPPRGAERVLEPGGGMTSGQWTSLELVVTGRAGEAAVVEVDATALGPGDASGAAGPDGAVRTSSPETIRSPLRLTGAQRRVLTAMAEPLLTERGARAVPATYAQVGRRLGLQPAYVRNVIKALREELTGHGVPGLGRDDRGDEGPEDFRTPLTHWALHNGWVTAEDVATLPSPSDPAHDLGELPQ